MVAFSNILPSRWRSRILGRHGDLCDCLAAYVADACLWILDILSDPSRNNVDLFADI